MLNNNSEPNHVFVSRLFCITSSLMFLIEPLKSKQTNKNTYKFLLCQNFMSSILVMVVRFPNNFDNVIEARKFDDMLSLI